ncbi:MAG: AAA family ATPase [Candidatus Rokubacteria bacterium]|nr:AAA family ATPase [Candidatus Rokubacteria bacterium]
MKCPACQRENPAGARFCTDCGARLDVACPACQHANPAGSRFCNSCGDQLGAEAPAAPTSRFPSLHAYTPKHLAEKILSSKSALEGERKQVTVLFADLKGSMELLADRDPEEARRLLDPVLERMIEAVHRYEGTVNQVMGDGIMALFGAPVAHEDHGVRACYAAWDMQAALRRYADELRRVHGVAVQIRVGLNSGEVVVRAIGSDLRMDYTAVGQTTHLAARMEQLASPGSTLLTAETLRLAEGYIAVRPLGPVPVKGLETPIEVYEMTGAGPLRSRLHAAAARGLTRFVGRERELEQLRQALGRAGAGHGQVVALIGEPGVGKSRLVWEVTHSHRTHGWLILQAGSVSYGKATPYLPVIDLLKAYFKIQERDDPREIREKVTGKLLTLDRAFEAALATFLALLDVPVEDPVWQALDPVQRRRRTLDAVKRLLLRECQVQPLLLVFEDLHWIDTETQALLDSLVESLPAARILLLVNYRPEYEHPWGRKTYYTQLRLDPLPHDRAEELLDALLGRDAGLRPLKPLLIERTEGNPFFLEESVRTLVESQVLVGERGAYRLVKPAHTIQVPASVQAVLAARIDRLPPEEKALLQIAAVIGKDVSFALLQAIAEDPEEALRRSLTHIQAAEFLYEARLFPDLEYTFKHALTHEVAYGSLLQDRRRVLHARIMEAIERLYAERLAEQVERLAHHAFRGEAWAKAVAYLRQAGAKAYGHSAYRQAAACCEQALVALGHLPESREILEQAFDLRIDLRHASFMLGESGRVLESLAGAEPLATTLGDQGRLAVVTGFMGNYFWWTGQPDRASAYGERALALFEAAGDVDRVRSWSFAAGQAYHALGDYRRAISFLRRAVELHSGDRVRQRLGAAGFPSVFSRTWLAWCLAELGELREARAHADEAIKIAEALEHPFSLVQAYAQHGHLALLTRAPDKAISVLERALRVSRLATLPFWLPWVAAALGFAYALSGRMGEVFPLFEEALEQATATQFMFGQSLRVAWLSEAHLLAGRMDEAIPLAEQALELAREHKERGHEAWALRLLGEITAHREPPDVRTAEDYYHQALALADGLGMRPLLTHCHLGLGTLYRRTGELPKALEHLGAAAPMYRDMDMGVWLKKAEEQLEQVRR